MEIHRFSERTGWEVPLSFTFVTLLLTGYAPALALTPFYWAAAPVSLAAAALVLRWRSEPSGAEPRKALGAVPRRYRRLVAIGLAVAGPLTFAYVLAFAATHPVRWSGDTNNRTYAYEPGKLHRYDVPLANVGQGTITDLSVVRVESSPALQLERAGVRQWPGPLRPLTRLELEPGFADDRLTLELRQGRVCPTGIAELDAVWIRYTVHGMGHEQRVPLQQPPGVRCPIGR